MVNIFIRLVLVVQVLKNTPAQFEEDQAYCEMCFPSVYILSVSQFISKNSAQLLNCQRGGWGLHEMLNAIGPSGAAVDGSNLEEDLDALVQEGKQLLREGRELTKSGFDLGGADLALQDAVACFEDAAQIDSTSIKVQVTSDLCLSCLLTLPTQHHSD